MNSKQKRWLLAGVSLFVLLGLYLFQNLATPVRVMGFLFGLFVFYIVDEMFKIKFKLIHYYEIMIILAFGILFSALYGMYPIYDKILHFLLPILGCFLMFHIVNKQKLSFQWKMWITFLFITTFLAFHEIGEYLIDLLWDMQLQGVYVRDIENYAKLNLTMSKIDDTMIDLILGVLGSIIFIIGKTIKYIYTKSFGKKKS